MIVGPVARIEIAGGTAPLYLLRFDKDGTLLSRQTAQQLLTATASASDIFLFSHGWNNTYDQALNRYRDFASGFIRQRQELALPVPDNYKPILVGVIWPSTSFLLPWEKGPKIAAAGGPESARELEELLGFVTESMNQDTTAAFVELIDGRSNLGTEQAKAAVALVRDAVVDGGDPDAGHAAPEAADLLEAWRAIEQMDEPFVPDDPDDHGAPVGDSDEVLAVGVDAPVVAGAEVLDPRNLLRLGTMWKMKARAGVIGVNGVGPLMRDILRDTDARMHLAGHSFGARVLLSAVAAEPVHRPVHSILLLQPAVNRWCFAPQVPLTGATGGYHPVLSRVEVPVMTTFSSKDVALHEVFHLALRGRHLGEPDIAAIGDTDLYGALGGYGPSGLDNLTLAADALPPGTRYHLSPPTRVIAINGAVSVNGTIAISGHGDISTPATWWALHNLAAA